MFMITLVLNPRGAVGHMLIGREGCDQRIPPTQGPVVHSLGKRSHPAMCSGPGTVLGASDRKLPVFKVHHFEGEINKQMTFPIRLLNDTRQIGTQSSDCEGGSS